MRILLFLFASCFLPMASAAGSPNIIYVMVDDMGPADAGCFGSKVIQTPHLDRMAQEGLHVPNHYSGCTVCAPCRSVLMTGKHMGRTSVRLNTGAASEWAASEWGQTNFEEAFSGRQASEWGQTREAGLGMGTDEL